MNNYKVFNISVVGASHLDKGTVMQDSSASYADERMIIAVIADGHGSKHYFRSDKGSSFATEATVQCIKEFILQANASSLLSSESEHLFAQLNKSIISRWNSLVGEHYSENAFTEEELELSGKYRDEYLNGYDFVQAYGSTLLAIAITDEYWFGVHIGDGICVAIYDNGEFAEPIPWDDKCQLNVCTSICDKNASDEFRFFCDKRIPIAVFVGSDGIDDSFGREYSAQKQELLYNFYNLTTLTFASQDFDKTKQNLEDYLSQLSEMGSRDDVSVAGFLNCTSLESAKPWLELRQEAFNKKRALKTLENDLEKLMSSNEDAIDKQIEEMKNAISEAQTEYDVLVNRLSEFF